MRGTMDDDGRDQAPAPAASAGNRRADDAPRLKDLVVITGFSGAGKSTAMNVFEDAGYFCVDNLPPEMIRSLVELFVHEGSKVERAAVVSDVRGGVYFEALRAVVDDLDALGHQPPRAVPGGGRADAGDPLQGDPPAPSAAPEGSVAAGVAAERALLEPLRSRADLVIDTTGMSAAMLREKIAEEFLPRQRGRPSGGDVHELRLQARPAARGGPGASTCASWQIRTTSTSCAS